MSLHFSANQVNQVMERGYGLYLLSNLCSPPFSLVPAHPPTHFFTPSLGLCLQAFVMYRSRETEGPKHYFPFEFASHLVCWPCRGFILERRDPWLDQPGLFRLGHWKISFLKKMRLWRMWITVQWPGLVISLITGASASQSIECERRCWLRPFQNLLRSLASHQPDAAPANDR